jgi:hypothetical protein
MAHLDKAQRLRSSLPPLVRCVTLNRELTQTRCVRAHLHRRQGAEG